MNTVPATGSAAVPGDPLHRPSEPDPAITRWLADRALTAYDTAGGGTAGAAAAAALVASDVAELAADRSTAVAWPTTAVLPAAVAALLAAGRTDAAILATAIDLAASLMVLEVPTDATDGTSGGTGSGTDSGTRGGTGSGTGSGHTATVARLVPALLTAGITPMPGALNHTLSAATGRDVTAVPGGRA